MSKVSKYMSTDLHSITPDRFVFEAVDEMENRKISALLVKKGGKYTGIITKTDWMLLALQQECDPKILKVSSFQSLIKYSIDKDQTIPEACSLMEKHSVRHLPVTKDNEVVGIISVKDIERYYMDMHKKTEF